MKYLLALLLATSFIKAMETNSPPSPAAAHAAKLLATLRKNSANNNSNPTEEIDIEQFRDEIDEHDKGIYEQKLKFAPPFIKGILAWKKEHPKGTDLPNYLLITGRTGTSKSTIAKAMGHKIGQVFFVVPSDIMKPRHEPAERLTKLIHQIAAQQTPSVLILDELGTLTCRHASNPAESDMIASALCTSLNKQERNPNFFLIGITREPKKMPISMQYLFEQEVVEMLPGNADQRKAFITHFKTSSNVQLCLSLSDLHESFTDEWIKQTEGFTDRDLKRIVNNAKIFAYTDFANGKPLVLSKSHFKKAFQNDEEERRKFWDFSDPV